MSDEHDTDAVTGRRAAADVAGDGVPTSFDEVESLLGSLRRITVPAPESEPSRDQEPVEHSLPVVAARADPVGARARPETTDPYHSAHHADATRRVNDNETTMTATNRTEAPEIERIYSSVASSYAEASQGRKSRRGPVREAVVAAEPPSLEWDQEQADALAEVLESDLSRPVPQVPMFRDEPALVPLPRIEPRSLPAAASARLAPAAVQVADFDRGWLEQRFADMRQSLEELIARTRPDAAVAALGDRIAALEQQIADAIAAEQPEATEAPSDGDAPEGPLPRLEAQVEHLQAQLHEAVTELARIARIEDGMSRLIAKVDETEHLLGDLATAMAERTADSVIDRLNAAAPGHAETHAGAAAAGGPDHIAGIHQALASLASHRDQSEGRIHALMIDTKAMVDGLSSRLETIEHVIAAATSDDPVHDTVAQPEAPELAAEPMSETPIPAPVAVVPSLEVPTEDELEEDLAPRAFGQRDSTAAPSVASPQAPAPSAVPSRPSLSLEEAEAQLAQAPRPHRGPTSREEMIASARRAAMSMSRPAASGGSSAARSAESTLKSLFQFDKSAGGTRPWLIIVAVIFIAAGAGLLYGKLVRRPQPTIHIEKSEPAAGSTGAPAAPASGGAGTPGKQSSLDGQDDGDDLGTFDVGAAETGDIDTSAMLAEISPEVSAPEAGSADLPAASTSSITPVALGSDDTHRLDMPPARIAPLSLRQQAVDGDPVAQFEIGQRFLQGKGGASDLEQAGLWLTRSAKAGYPLAQYRLATLYERGRGVAQDADQARAWYERAAGQGNTKAMHNLGVLLTGQSGAAADYPAAAEWFQRAAQLGLADSQFNLGILFENGLGVSRDPAAAYKWYGLAAKRGDKEAVKRRTQLKAKLPPEAVAAADAEVKAWRAKPADRMANDGVAVGEFRPKAAGTGSAPLKSAAAETASVEPSPDVAVVQELLGRVGFEVGEADGILTEETTEAIRQFEERSGMTPTGEVSEDLIARLRQLAG